MSAGRVSVVIPTRNRLDRLRRALASVERQTYRNFDVWVVNDGSSDGTAEFLKSGNLRERYARIPAITVLDSPAGRGAAAARNRAVQAAKGEFVAFLDDDDEWLPEYLERQVELLGRHAETLACCARHVEIDRSGRVLLPDLEPLFDYESQLVRLLTESFVHSMSVVVCRREAFVRVGFLNEGLQIVHDQDWYARLLLSGASFAFEHGPPLVRRGVSEGLVSRYRDWYAEELDVLSRAVEERREFVGNPRHILAHRALYFARLGLQRGDYGFAASRLAEAIWTAPLRSITIALRRIRRNARLARLREQAGETGAIGHDQRRA